MRLKNRPSYYHKNIVKLNKIELDRMTVWKIDFSKGSVSEIRYMTEYVLISTHNTAQSFGQFG